jgi:hypothetical protein
VRTKQIPAAKLVLDYKLYPRHHLDDVNVRGIANSLDAGEEPPPVVAERSTLRVVDGFHRVAAYLRRDTEAVIAVELVDYESDAELFEDAMRRNARHGVKLNPFDRSRCVQIGTELGLDVDRIAGALAVDVDVLGKLKAAKTAYDHDGKPLPIKRPLRHLAGQRLTERQERANRRSSGWSVRFHAEQIIQAIEGDVCDWTDEATVTALREVQALLTGRFGELEAAA